MATAVQVFDPGAAKPAQLAIADKGTLRSARETGKRLLRVAEVLWGPPADPAEPFAYPWASMTYADAEVVKAALREDGLKPATVNGHLAALKSAAKHCWLQDQMSKDQQERIQNVRGARGHSEVGRVVDGGEVAAIFHLCKQDVKRARGRRDAAIFALGFGGGLRRAEAIAAQVADYDATSGELLIRQGKGGKDRRVWLPTGARRALRDWLEVRGDAPGAILCPVLKSGRPRPGRKMSAQAMVARIKARLREAGVGDFSSHDMRRTLITNLIDDGQLRSAQVIAGHASVSTTAKYDRRGKERAKAAQRKLDIPY